MTLFKTVFSIILFLSILSSMVFLVILAALAFLGSGIHPRELALDVNSRTEHLPFWRHYRYHC